MQDYIIFTDSSADLPIYLTKKLSVEVLPLKFTIENKTYSDNSDVSGMDMSEFYGKLRDGKISNTSQVNPNEFVTAFSEILGKGFDILYICFSSALSNTYASAKIAQDELKEKYPGREIIIIDSLCASLGQGLLVYLVIQKKLEGFNINQLKNWINSNKLYICHWVAVDDLNYLRRGGRVSATSAFLGNFLNIKPIIHLSEDGKLNFVTKIRGRQRSLDFLVDKMKELGTDLKEQTIFICHGDCLKEVEDLKSNIQKKLGLKNFIVNYIGPVIGSHAGPGTIAVFFIGTKR
ncbi:MAG: fatty acid-binding protein DegV [Candidatus Paraimprobicoccus trichonymphae]|uniref:Fatty acid-binding protein DegV n=1 Tax=Candidatus Paraimprobicoccus trichonymphae TaxID=3033793 RepID=A0AA48HW88_9FIRM|nr:MAG: fatty acid-binding protein DegV [Candidatus Paraimprobicoccus trichonymphae]